jgi:hypothetical protein
MYEEKTGLWVEVIENLDEAQAYLLVILSKEMTEVDLFFGGSNSNSIVWVKGAQHRVKWFMHLYHEECEKMQRYFTKTGAAS